MSALKEVKPFLIGQLAFLIVGIILLVIFEKKELHLIINQIHHPVADGFFKYETKLAEGLAIGSAVLLLLLYKVRYGIIMMISTTGAGLTTQFLKRVVFNDHHRPMKAFENIVDLHLIDGVELHKSFSFPSGHSTAAFALFLTLAFVLRKPKWQLVCLAMALTTAFSRVYLSQHFMQDIVAGSIIGSGFSLIVIFLLKNRQWGEKGLLANFDTNRNRA
ncbi:MAG: phosphatase PAP2 family protein [Flavobacteriales bacterium]